MYIRTLPLCTPREGSSQSNQLACSPFCVRLRAYASNTWSTDNTEAMQKIADKECNMDSASGQMLNKTFDELGMTTTPKS
jgi:hypothetical protein